MAWIPFSLKVVAFAFSVILTGFSAYKQSSSTASFYNELWSREQLQGLFIEKISKIMFTFA